MVLSPSPSSDALLYDKGVEALVRAHEILNKRGLRVRALLAGVPDPSNPASIHGSQRSPTGASARIL